MFPQNLVEACISQYQTVLRLPEPEENDTLNELALSDTILDVDSEDIIRNASGNCIKDARCAINT